MYSENLPTQKSFSKNVNFFSLGSGSGPKRLDPVLDTTKKIRIQIRNTGL
jgi:hypothetical protein